MTTNFTNILAVAALCVLASGLSHAKPAEMDGSELKETGKPSKNKISIRNKNDKKYVESSIV